MFDDDFFWHYVLVSEMSNQNLLSKSLSNKKKILDKHFFYKRTAVRTLNLTNANLGQSKEEASFDPKSK